MSILLTLILIAQLAAIAAGIYAWRKTRQRLSEFVTSPGKDQPSELAQYIDLAGQVLIARALTQLTSRENNARSIEVRQAAAMDKAIVKDSLSNINPLFAILASRYPSVVKQLAKNQELLPYIMELAGKMQGGGNGHNHNVDNPPMSYNQANMF